MEDQGEVSVEGVGEVGQGRLSRSNQPVLPSEVVGGFPPRTGLGIIRRQVSDQLQ